MSNTTKRRNRRAAAKVKAISTLTLLLASVTVGSWVGGQVAHRDLERAETKAEAADSMRSLGTYRLTAYCPCRKCCGKWANGITASGVKAQAGVTIAADTRKLPFGTKVVIDGHEYTVQDRGGAIKGNRIDVYFDTHQEALAFGVQYKTVYLQ